MQGWVEGSHSKARFESPGALVREFVGGVQSADVPHQCLSGMLDEIGKVVGERAPVEWISVHADVVPNGELYRSGSRSLFMR